MAAATDISNAPPADIPAAQSDSVVTPFEVKGKQDYDRLIQEFGTQKIDETLLQRFERITGHKPHRLLRRGLFFSHRDFDKILTCYEKGETFFIYTGRGPSSSSMHVGHTIPFDFTKWLSEVFDMPLVIMLTDDEKFLYTEKMTINESIRMTQTTVKDLLSFRFDERKTFIFNDFSRMGGHFYHNCVEFARLISFNQVRGTFGFDQSTNIGFINFPSVQNAAAFATSYPELFGDDPASTSERNPKTAAIPCLIPCGIDQDPYFRLLRSNAHRMSLKSPPPALIHGKFLTSLQGPEGKMSASLPNSAIFLSDTPKQIKDKINKHAFSGGQETLEEQRAKGGDPDIDVAFQLLRYFLEDDDELESIRKSYRAGEMLTGEIKKKAIEVMQEYVADYQKRRDAVTEEEKTKMMMPRLMEFGGNPNPGFMHSVNGQALQQTGADGAKEDDEHPGHDSLYPKHPERPQLNRKRTYGVEGLRQYEHTVSEMIYPTKSRE